MTPTVVKGYPPNFQAIKEVLPGAIGPNVIFAYGERIYIPSGRPLPIELHAHERVHCRRQIEMGVDRWWCEYLSDLKFRFNEELLAHRAEYRAIVGGNKAHQRGLEFAARRLAGPLYGGLCTADQARELILAP